MSAGIMVSVEIVQVTRADGSTDRYVLEEQQADGALLVRPDTRIEAIRQRLGTEPVSDAEFNAAFGDLPTGPV